MNSQTITLILWTILLVISILGLGVAAIVTLCLRDEKQRRAYDCVLVLSTAVIALNLTTGLVTKDLDLKSAKKHQAQQIVEHDIWDRELLFMELTEYAQAPLKQVILFEAASDFKTSLSEAEADLEKKTKKFPDSLPLADRWALVLNAEKQGVKSAFDPYRKRWEEADEEDEESLRKVSTFRPLLQRLIESPLSDAKSIVRYKKLALQFPYNGWYAHRMDLLITALEGKQSFDRCEASFKDRAEKYLQKVELLYISHAVLCVIGFAFLSALIFAAKALGITPVGSDFVPITKSFRRMYTCLISILLGHSTFGILIGFGVGLYIGLNHVPNGLHKFSFFITAATTIAGIITFLLVYYFGVAKPESLGALQAYARNAINLKPVQIVAYCFGGLGLVVLSSQFAHFVSRFLLKMGESTAQIETELVKATADGNTLMLVSAFVLACVIAPLIEELIFRGLVYGWLRNKYGVLVGILVNSAVFSLYHLNPNGFLHYFFVGCILSVIYERTRNLWLCAAVHALWNIVATTSLVLGTP